MPCTISARHGRRTEPPLIPEALNSQPTGLLAESGAEAKQASLAEASGAEARQASLETDSSGLKPRLTSAQDAQLATPTPKPSFHLLSFSARVITLNPKPKP